MNLVRKIYLGAYSRIVLHSEYYKRQWGYANKFWYIPLFNLDVVNLGSDSALHAFDYSGTNLKGMNWAVVSQTLAYDYSVLKNYFSYLKHGATVIITISPLSCLLTQISKEQNLKYYTCLHPATVQGFEEGEHLKALTLKRQNVLKVAPVKTICGVVNTWMKSIFCKMHTCNFKKDSANVISIWKEQYGIAGFEETLSDKNHKEQNEQAELLCEMVTFCIERDLRPVLVFPPIHVELKNSLSAPFFEHYLQEFVNKANQSGVPFLNYLDDSELQRNEYFYNSLFLNKTGGRLFTQKVLKDMKML